jgi:hypothetical protein
MCFNPMQAKDDQVFFLGCGTTILIKKLMINGLFLQELRKALGRIMSQAL